jgi:hypothetical protein
MTTINIDVRDETVTCGTNGGHVRLQQGNAITWRSTGNDKKFELQFSRLGFETEDLATDPVHWPFNEAPPTAPTNSFTGTLRSLAPQDSAPAYKYNVKVGTLILDPIVIVDR